MINTLRLLAAAARLNNILHSDSHVTVSQRKLEDALRADAARNGGNLPSESEMNELVMGDDDGEISEALIKCFPNTHRVLGEPFA